MIKVSTIDDYTDFKNFLDAFGSRRMTVVYKTDNSTFFIARGSNGEVGVEMTLGSGKPGTFDADFPQAVQVSTDYSLTLL